MLSIIFSACVLVTVTMWIHASGIAVLLRGLMKLDSLPPTSGVANHPVAAARMIWWLILIHVIEISVWALFYF